MRTRKDKLQLLQVASPCDSSWEAMHGDERRRHCLQCDKHVYDFAQLTPREIAGVVEANQGHLCARLKRDEWGRLITLEPPMVDPLAPRRASPLVAAVVTAVLGLGVGLRGDATDQDAIVAAAELEADRRLRGEQPQRTGAGHAGDTGSVLSGRLANEAGEPVPGATVWVYSEIDDQQRSGQTDAEGRFSFTLTPGIYQIRTAVDGHAAAWLQDVQLSAGEKRQIGLTVPADVWQRVVAGELPDTVTAGVIAMDTPPMRKVYDRANLVVLAVVKKSVITEEDEYSSEVRTDLVISSVLKGETRERVVSLYHSQRTDEDPESRLQPGNNVVAFLDPRDAEDGRGTDGYTVTDHMFGFQKLDKVEVAAYRERLEALAEVPKDGMARLEETLEWLVATAEDPVTRKEAVEELGEASWKLQQQAEQHGSPVDLYAQGLRDVLADFFDAGGTPNEWNLVIFGAFLTDEHRERLTKALLSTEHVTDADLGLYYLVSRWHDDQMLPWLIDHAETVELSDEAGWRLLRTVAQVLDDAALVDLLTAGEEQIGDLRQQLDEASEAAARQRLGAQVTAAEKEVKRKFVDALGRR